MPDQDLTPKPILISRIQVRRGTTEQWAIANPVLEEGELGFDTTLNKIKIGDGIRNYLDLPFIAGQRFSDDFEIIEDVVYLYKSPIITLTGGTTREIGEVVIDVILSWTLSKQAISRIFTSGPLLGLELGPGGSDTYTHSDANLTSNTTYTLTVDDSRTISGSSTTVRFTNRRYWGTNQNQILEDADILNLASELAFDRKKTWTQNGGGEYIYFCYPASWGTATFTVNGLLNTAWTLSIQDHVNQWGVSTSYHIYRTNDIQFGNAISIKTE